MNGQQLIDKVLQGLRQYDLLLGSGTTSTTDNYILMILQFVNEAKEEIEECGWPWQALRNTVTLTLSASTVSYALTAAGPADTDTNDRSRLLYESVVASGHEGFRDFEDDLPQVFDVTTSAEVRLTEVPLETMERWHLTDSDETGSPTYFAIWSDGTNLNLKVWPIPDATYTLKLRIFIPQSEVASDGLDTTVKAPGRPIWTRALVKANAERGEELSRPGGDLDRAAMDALGTAAGKEQTQTDQTVHLVR